MAGETNTKIVTFTDANFEELVLKSDQPVLVDFWAEWCGPCKALTPTIEALAKKYEGKAVIGKLDVASESRFSTKYGISAIPALLVFKGGEVVEEVIGFAPQSLLEGKLNNHVSVS
jgi:thioredoxin 1